MAEMTSQSTASSKPVESTLMSPPYPYEQWVESLGVPIHKGYFIPDLRTLELGWWAERECNAAFIELAGAEGITEARVTEIPPGKRLPPMRFAFDELVYVVDGRGLTTVSGPGGGADRLFEWQKHSLFVLPHDRTHQLSNAQGDRPARLLHYNYLPLAMTGIFDANFFFNNPYTSAERSGNQAEDFYSEAKQVRDEGVTFLGADRYVWVGNFFPDMRAWDKVDPLQGRGAGGGVVWLRFPGTLFRGHMSVFPARTYKKAHRHGPGTLIVIPVGEGYSILWPEGQEKIVVPWQEASVFVPPDQWYHQHFNAGGSPARYLALHSPPQFAGRERTDVDRARNQIEYPNEDPWIREKFEGELASRGLTSLMADEAYRDPNFSWKYAVGGGE